MHALIHISLSESIRYSYEKELLVYIKENYPDIIIFDLDNHSDTLMFNYAIELIEKSSKAIIVIESENDFFSSKISMLSEKVIRHKDKCLVIMNEENKMLNKIFSQLKNNFFNNLSPEEERKVIKEFLKSCSNTHSAQS